MIRFATLLALTSVLAMGCNQTLLAAQERPQASSQPPGPAQQPNNPLQIARSASGEDKNADSILERMGLSSQAPSRDIPEEARRALRRALHGSFLVFYARVQEDLKLTTEQKDKLEQHLQERYPDAMQFFQKIERLKREDREQELGAYRQKAQERLAAVLKATLNAGQRKRLRQLELQHEGPFSAETWKELKVTDEQLKQFTPVVQSQQEMIEALIKSGSNPEEIWPKIEKVRKQHGDRIVALLSDAQKKQWKEMIGKPLDLGD